MHLCYEHRSAVLTIQQKTLFNRSSHECFESFPLRVLHVRDVTKAGRYSVVLSERRRKTQQNKTRNMIYHCIPFYCTNQLSNKSLKIWKSPFQSNGNNEVDLTGDSNCVQWMKYLGEENVTLLVIDIVVTDILWGLRMCTNQWEENCIQLTLLRQRPVENWKAEK